MIVADVATHTGYQIVTVISFNEASFKISLIYASHCADLTIRRRSDIIYQAVEDRRLAVHHAVLVL